MSSKYIADPSKKHTVLSEAELIELMGGVQTFFPKHAEAAHHLLGRMITTVRESDEWRSKVAQQFSALQAQVKAQGRSTTLNPVDAVRFISTTDLEAVLAERGAAVDTETTQKKVEAELELRKVRSANGKVQGALQKLLDDAELPQATKVEVEKALRLLNGAVEDLPTSDNLEDVVNAVEEAEERSKEDDGEEIPQNSSWVTAHQAETVDELGDLFS